MTHTHPSSSAPRLSGACVTLAALVAIVATLGLGAGAQSWIGRTVPGFFVLPNRVIPSVGLTHWSGTVHGGVYQRVVVAIDGTPVESAPDAYARVELEPPGHEFVYTLRDEAGTANVTVPSRTFTRLDWAAIFGAYLGTGLLYVLVGLLGAWWVADPALARAILLLGATGGIFAFSAVGLYGPGTPLRIHALSEALFPATLVQLALLVGCERDDRTRSLIALGWWLALALAAVYQILLHQPGAYSVLHGATEAYMGFGGLLLIVQLVLEHARAQRPPVLLRGLLGGAVLGLGVPAVVMALSGLSGGALPVNVCAATAFLFPLSLGAGIVRERLGRPGLAAAAPAPA